MGAWLLKLCKTTLYVVVLFVLITEAKNYTVQQKISDDSDLSEFYGLLQNNAVANSTLQHRQATIFAPLNIAFKGEFKDKLSIPLYHMTNLGYNLDQLPDYLNSELDGNPPLWITKKKVPGQYKDVIYVNNAKILRERSDYVQTYNGKRQVLHIIDSVLEPVTSLQSQGQQVYNPNAFQFMNQSEILDLNNHRVRSFRQRVNQMEKGDIFKADGRHTFFIPVDEGFEPPPRPEKIDKKVIDGHVIPNHVLFTNAVDKDKDYETLAFGDMVRVSISFTQQTDGKLYVKSNTVVGDANHATGVVLAEIVKANIPVKNGVVHLIHRPLMVVDNTVQQFLQSFKENTDGLLHKFYSVIQDVSEEYMKRIVSSKDMTLFAPSNEAWADSNILNNLLSNREKMLEILYLHLVPRRLPIDKIMELNINEAQTAAGDKKLYFNVVHHGRGNNLTLTVEGGGVNATVIQPNIAATNGIVHIIDRVLGVPFTTVEEKLATDPMLNKTYQLGKQHGFNKELRTMKKKLTYFVPRDWAWSQAEINTPSTHKKMFMSDYGYHVKQILERHLVVSDRVFTMAELKVIGNATLPTVRDHLKIRVREENKKFYIEWQGDWVYVFRPDVECTNGIIHVIDKVFMKESDIRVVAAGTALPVLAPQLAMVIIAKWLL